MKSRQLRELRRALRDEGYPPAYISRLVHELHDHLESAREQADDEGFAVSQPIEPRLGSCSAILAAVNDHPELQSWPQRYPLLIFVMVPGTAICLLTIFFVYLAELLARGEILGDSSVKLFALRSFSFSTLVISAALASCFACVAVRARVHVTFLAAAMLLMAAGSLFKFDLGDCRQSSGAVAYSHFGLDTLKLASMACIFAIAWFAARRRTVRLRDAVAADHKSATARQSPPLYLMLIGITASLCAFGWSADYAAERVRRHPADNLVDGIRSPHRHASLVVELLGAETVLADLRIDPRHLPEVSEITGDWNDYSQQAMHEWQLVNPDLAGFQEFRADVLTPRLRQVERSLRNRLSETQQQRLGQIIYQRLGCDALFLDAVQRELGVSHNQEVLLKDLLVERTIRTTKLHKMRMERRQGITEAQCDHDRWCAAHIDDILTEAQACRLAELRGAPCLLPAR